MPSPMFMSPPIPSRPYAPARFRTLVAERPTSLATSTQHSPAMTRPAALALTSSVYGGGNGDHAADPGPSSSSGTPRTGTPARRSPSSASRIPGSTRRRLSAFAPRRTQRTPIRTLTRPTFRPHPQPRTKDAPPITDRTAHH